jgi:hypothetical protein
LFSRRKQEKELREREARGESFWTNGFSEAVRTKILYAFRDNAEGMRAEMADRAHRILVRDRGVGRLTKSADTPAEDLVGFLTSAPDGEVPDVVEAMFAALSQGSREFGYFVPSVGGFRQRVNQVFAEHRVAFELSENGEMIPFTSRELHVAVVAPTLTLLSGEPRLAKVEHAYQQALEELSNGKPSDAITDAGTALQEMLTALGCEGNALGPLINSGKKRGLFQPYDQKLLEWVSADRSQFGDSHHVADPTMSDAWLTVHVVGALVLRLSDGQARGQV